MPQYNTSSIAWMRYKSCKISVRTIGSLRRPQLRPWVMLWVHKIEKRILFTRSSRSAWIFKYCANFDIKGTITNVIRVLWNLTHNTTFLPLICRYTLLWEGLMFSGKTWSLSIPNMSKNNCHQILVKFDR